MKHSLSFELCILCVVHVFLYLDIWWVCHVWVHASFLTVSNASSVFTNVFVCWVTECLSCFGCDSSYCHRVGLCLCSVCVYVLCAFLRWRGWGFCFCALCVWVSFSQSQHPMKKRNKPTKKHEKTPAPKKVRKQRTWKQQSQQQITAKGITKQEITKTLKHEKTKSWDKPLGPHTHTRQTHNEDTEKT